MRIKNLQSLNSVRTETVLMKQSQSKMTRSHRDYKNDLSWHRKKQTATLVGFIFWTIGTAWDQNQIPSFITKPFNGLLNNLFVERFRDQSLSPPQIMTERWQLVTFDTSPPHYDYGWWCHWILTIYHWTWIWMWEIFVWKLTRKQKYGREINQVSLNRPARARWGSHAAVDFWRTPPGRCTWTRQGDKILLIHRFSPVVWSFHHSEPAFHPQANQLKWYDCQKLKFFIPIVFTLLKIWGCMFIIYLFLLSTQFFSGKK